ncbi:hypothetical protein J4E93_005186 [Alternaria ventricosa]|uniref:uncharacterized protein n=1 Tax=Alternaria ventricosa TaxID=1187951 RepID=UPI0020C243BB|nr:uncharacterized protein J4E93_005186 [Alternaria ventricosa]KAI4646962.1 hypothetical protein J4E93_005186 [Alternaria ventricosa]
MTGPGETITLELNSATALVKKMRSMGYLDVTSYLRGSKHFTRNTTLYPAQYLTATRAANILISKLLNYLSITLSPLENQTRTLTIADLVKEMTEVIRLDIFWWVSEWCFRNQVERRDNAMERAWKLKGCFGMARRDWTKGRMSRGVEVLFERMVGIVEMVVAMLLWWDGEMRTERMENLWEGSESSESEESSESGESSDSDESCDFTWD